MPPEGLYPSVRAPRWRRWWGLWSPGRHPCRVQQILDSDACASSVEGSADGRLDVCRCPSYGLVVGAAPSVLVGARALALVRARSYPASKSSWWGLGSPLLLQHRPLSLGARGGGGGAFLHSLGGVFAFGGGLGGACTAPGTVSRCAD